MFVKLGKDSLRRLLENEWGGDSMEGFVINYLDNWVARRNWNKCKWNSLLKRMIWNNWESKGCERNRKLENTKGVKMAKDID